jgi:hypothetical protein
MEQDTCTPEEFIAFIKKTRRDHGGAGGVEKVK